MSKSRSVCIILIPLTSNKLSVYGTYLTGEEANVRAGIWRNSYRMKKQHCSEYANRN